MDDCFNLSPELNLILQKIQFTYTCLPVSHGLNSRLAERNTARTEFGAQRGFQFQFYQECNFYLALG